MAMKLLAPLVTGAIALVVYLVAARIASWLRMRHIPGPAGVGWSKFWLIRHQVPGKLVLDLEKVCEKYGASRRQCLLPTAIPLMPPSQGPS